MTSKERDKDEDLKVSIAVLETQIFNVVSLIKEIKEDIKNLNNNYTTKEEHANLSNLVVNNLSEIDRIKGWMWKAMGGMAVFVFIFPFVYGWITK